MNASLRPLVVRTALRDGESLTSLLARLVRLNAINPPKLLYDLCFEQSPTTKRGNFDAPLTEQILENIRIVSGLDADTVLNATNHTFACSLTKHAVLPRNAMAFREFQMFLPGIQYCPYCIAEQAYHRLVWMLRFVTLCPKHHCLLLNACPHCSAPISVMSIIDKYCERCDQPLAFPGGGAQHTSMKRAQSLYVLLEAILASQDVTPYIPEGSIPFAITRSSSLFIVLNDIQTFCIERGTAWIDTCMAVLKIPRIDRAQHAFAPHDREMRYYTTLIALTVFIGGSTAWKKFLACYHIPCSMTSKDYQSLQTCFGSIYKTVGLKWATDPFLAPIYDASIEFLVEHPQIPMSHDDCLVFQKHQQYGRFFAFITIKDLASDVGVPWEILYRLIVHWNPAFAYIDHDRNMYFRKALTHVIRDNLDTPLVDHQIEAILGLPIPVIRELRGDDALISIHDVLMWGKLFWENTAIPVRRDMELLPIGRAASTLAQQKYQLMSTIFWCIQKKVIPAYTDTPYNDIQRVSITKEALQRGLQVFHERWNQRRLRVLNTHANDGIRLAMIPERYGVPMHVAQEWIHLGYLDSWQEDGPGKPAVCSERVFQQLLINPPGITVRDLAWFWGIAIHQVMGWVQSGLLAPDVVTI